MFYAPALLIKPSQETASIIFQHLQISELGLHIISLCLVVDYQMSKDMKEQRERCAILPFSFGCSSRSSVAVGSPSPLNDATLFSRQGRQKDSAITKKTKNSLSLLRRLIRSLKSASQFFVYKEEIDDEEEKEMEIGYPTDVKHLTHIGWDGSTTISNAAKGWENLTPSEIISFPSISLKQFEVAMAEQAAAAAATAVGDKPL